MTVKGKRLALCAGVVGGLLLAAGCRSASPDVQEAAQPAEVAEGSVSASVGEVEAPIGVTVRPRMLGMSIAAVEATGMSCPLCASNIESVLTRHPGVGDVVVDLGSGKVYVGLRPGAAWPSSQEMAAAVRDAGFTPVRVVLPEGGAL